MRSGSKQLLWLKNNATFSGVWIKFNLVTTWRWIFSYLNGAVEYRPLCSVNEPAANYTGRIAIIILDEVQVLDGTNENSVLNVLLRMMLKLDSMKFVFIEEAFYLTSDSFN